MRIHLTYRPPFAMGALLSFLGDRAIPGVETFDEGTFRRALRTRSGGFAVITLRPHQSESLFTLDTTAARDAADHADVARRVLDLDADPAPIDRSLARDPSLRPLVRSAPGIRLPGTFDGFELAVRAVLGQQVSVRAARTFAGRMALEAGTPLPERLAVYGLSHTFPTAEQLAEAPLDTIGLTRRRIDTLHRLAELVASGALDLSAAADVDHTKASLLAVPGIGGWTVEYVAMRALRDADSFPASDLGIRLGFEELGLANGLRAIQDRAERWRPWRAYAAMHVWHTLGTTS